MENYDRLRTMLSESFDTESNVSTTWYVMDATSKDKAMQWRIKTPKLPTNYVVDKLRDEIATKLDLQENELGTCAQISFPIKLSQVLTNEMQKGFLRGVVSTTPEDAVIRLELFISGDAHGIHRGVKVTRITFKLKVENMVFNNSPFQMYTVVFFRGSDNYANLQEHNTTFSRELSVLAKTPLTVGGRQFSIKLTHGSDLLFICASLAHYGVHGQYPCPFCFGEKDELLDTSKDFELRTYQKILELVHRAKPPFTCPAEGCKKHFPNQRAVDNDTLPTTKSGKKEQVRKHYGHFMHCQPVFPVWECEDVDTVISACIACLLHWLLRLIDLLFLFTIHIRADDEEKADALSKLLQHKGVSLNKKVKPYDAMRASKSRGDKTTFIGEHSASVLAEYSDYLDLHTPESRKDTYEDMWLVTYEFFELMWKDVEDTPENREAHAAEVWEKAKEMSDAITDGVPAIHSLYLHISLHLPLFIRKHGCNLRQYSGHGGEHLNKLGQMFAHAFTNKRMRVYRDKKTGGEKRQRVGMIGQNLRAEHVAGHVREAVPILTKWERKVMRLAAADQKKDDEEEATTV
ncbi:hypothetical protein CYMTET_8152 [Cymbomonas tetramitiformis]|uniref:Uncharacterized protein n=1 Tax=Cymbomonas tetramitiformis TaxID=36881 RepID=A0AAE0GTU3_9CHLO|nr:hypothetical protein CYMTET_8152 [Cymbomonas tetramitiformis]